MLLNILPFAFIPGFCSVFLRRQSLSAPNKPIKVHWKHATDGNLKITEATNHISDFYKWLQSVQEFIEVGGSWLSPTGWTPSTAVTRRARIPALPSPV